MLACLWQNQAWDHKTCFLRCQAQKRASCADMLSAWALNCALVGEDDETNDRG